MASGKWRKTGRQRTRPASLLGNETHCCAVRCAWLGRRKSASKARGSQVGNMKGFSRFQAIMKYVTEPAEAAKQRESVFVEFPELFFLPSERWKVVVGERGVANKDLWEMELIFRRLKSLCCHQLRRRRRRDGSFLLQYCEGLCNRTELNRSNEVMSNKPSRAGKL